MKIIKGTSVHVQKAPFAPLTGRQIDEVSFDYNDLTVLLAAEPEKLRDWLRSLCYTRMRVPKVDEAVEGGACLFCGELQGDGVCHRWENKSYKICLECVKRLYVDYIVVNS